MPIRTILISRSRSCLAPGQCVLTFDDGPAGKVTDDLLDVLHQFGVKACFCLVGSQVAMRREQTRAIAAAGHLLVNHTFYHRFADLWNLEMFSLDLARCDEAICDALGKTHHPLRWFRPPFGLVTAAVREMARTRRIMPVTHFIIDPWFRSDRAKRPATWMIKDARRHQGGIYVLHDGMMSSGISRSTKDTTDRYWIPDVVNEVLGKLTEAGFEFPDPSQVFQAPPL
jgi:peptidoglycan/xylan/chitin deacetylase (PgdA/CDA1 family)